MVIEAKELVQNIIRQERPVPKIQDWRQAQVVSAGVDIGSRSGQTVIMADGELISYSNIMTRPDSAQTAVDAMNIALAEAGHGMKLEDIHYVVGTGYGRFVVPFSKKNITEISCHARGAHYFFPGKVHTILDMGGQDCKAIHCDDTGKVTSFLMNDKCAAGTGRSMEVISSLFGVRLEDMGGLSLEIAKEPPPVSSTCTVFAKSEAFALRRKGMPVNEILAAYCDGLASRVVNLLKRVGIQPDFVITGGIAKNLGVVTRVIQRFEGLKAYICFEPQIAGAVGAALFGRDLTLKARKSP